MGNKKIIYAAVGIAAAFVLFKMCCSAPPKEARVGSPRALPAVKQAIEEPVIYDIQKMKGDGSAAVKPSPQGPEGQASAAQKEYGPEEISEAWKRSVPEEEKTRFISVLDNSIVGYREALRQNPNDEKARHMAALSEKLKKMALANFYFKKEEPPKK